MRAWNTIIKEGNRTQLQMHYWNRFRAYHKDTILGRFVGAAKNDNNKGAHGHYAITNLNEDQRKELATNGFLYTDKVLILTSSEKVNGVQTEFVSVYNLKGEFLFKGQRARKDLVEGFFEEVSESEQKKLFQPSVTKAKDFYDSKTKLQNPNTHKDDEKEI